MKTITGTFQYPNGTPVAGGKLILRLSQDAVALNTTQIAPRDVTITLNGSGAIPGATTVWANDELSPAGTFYAMSLIAPGGQLVWGGELFSLTGTSPLNLNTFQPVGSFTNPIYVNLPVFETNGTLNGSQSLLNLKNGGGITITDDGVGGITIAGGGATLETNGVLNTLQTLLNIIAGTNVTLTADGAGGVTIAALGGVSVSQANVFGSVPALLSNGNADATHSYALRIRGAAITLPWTGNVQIALAAGTTGLDINKVVIKSTVAQGDNYVSTANVLWGGLTAFTVPSNNRLYWSDPFNITFDTTHDYYIIINVGTVNTGIGYATPVASNLDSQPVNPSVSQTGDHTGDTTVSGGAWNWDGSIWRIFSGVRTS